MDSAFGRARLALGGLISAGIASSSMGEILQNRLAILSREVASVFVPQLLSAINAIERVIQFFRGLDIEQQKAIARWIAAGFAALTFAKMMPIVIEGVMGVVRAMRALTVAIVTMESSTGFGALLPIIGAAITALGTLAVITEVSQHGFSRFWQILQPLMVQMQALWKELQPTITMVFDAMQESIDLLMPNLKDFFAATKDLLVPILQQLGAQIAIIIRLGAHLVNWLLLTTTLVERLVTGPLKIMADLWTKIAQAVGFVFGRKMEEVKPPQEPGGPGGGHMSLAPRGSTGFESLTSAWERVAKASLAIGMGKPIEEQQLDVAKEQLMEQKKTNDQLARARPAFVP